VPVERHAGVKGRLGRFRGFRPSPEEPSVWVPEDPHSASARRIPEEQAIVLRDEGYTPEPVGLELEPPILILVVPRARIEAIASRAPVVPGLGTDLLATRFLALFPWS
jgi:hypothetical protein